MKVCQGTPKDSVPLERGRENRAWAMGHSASKHTPAERGASKTQYVQ